MTEATEKQTALVGWMPTTIGEIVEIVRGVTYRKEESSLEPSGRLIPIVRATNISHGLTFEDLVYVPPKCVSPEQFLMINDIVVAASSGSRAIVGKAAILSSEWKGSFGAFCCVLRPNQLIDARLLAYFLKTSEYRNQVSSLSAGVNINNLRREHIEGIPYRLGPSKEQKRIVEKLDELFSRFDAAVAALKRVRANLKRYRAAVLKAACEGRLVPTEAELARREGRSYEPASVLLERILAEHAPRKTAVSSLSIEEISALPSLPEGWTWATTEQVGKVQLGRQRAPQHHTGPHMRPYLRVANVFEDRIDTSDVRTMNFSPSEFANYELKYGDILLNEGQSLELVGRAAMYRDEVPGACFQKTLLRFSAYQGLNGKYALMVFLAYLHNKRFQKAARWTVNIAHLPQERLCRIEFPLPPLDEQVRIVDEVERRVPALLRIESQVRADLAKAERLRDSVLKRAFAGKLVPQDPNDEPASILLECIRAERGTEPKASPVRGRRKKEPLHVS